MHEEEDEKEEDEEREGGEGARAKPEPGRLQLATDHKAYEAPQACPVNKAIVPTRSAEHNTTRGLDPPALNMHGPGREDGIGSLCLSPALSLIFCR